MKNNNKTHGETQYNKWNESWKRIQTKQKIKKTKH